VTSKCLTCGNEYSVRSSWFDTGYCPLHKPKFFSAPAETLEGTKAVWKFNVVVHVLYLVFSLLLLDDGTTSTPLGIYAFTVLLYLMVRFFIGLTRGYPALTALQSLCLMLLPLWGPFVAFALFYWGQQMRYGHWAVRGVLWWS